MKRLVLIDGNSLINRAFYALPPLQNKAGIYTNGVYGFINMINRIIDEYKPDYMSVAFDLKGPTFRHKTYTEYKGTRKGMPEELRQQMPIVKEWLDKAGINRMEMSGFEADDLIGTVAKMFSADGKEVCIFTGDKDAMQLVDENINVYITKKGISELKKYDLTTIREEFDLEPKQFIDMKGLMGDKSDNIPGIPGVGEKTALKLLHQYGTLEKVLENVEEISGKKMKEKIRDNVDMAILSKKLGRIVIDIPLEFDNEEMALIEANPSELIEFYKKYQFTKLLKEVNASGGGQVELVLPEVIKSNASEVISLIKDDQEIHIELLGDRSNIMEDIPMALAIMLDEKKIYFVKEDVGTLFETEEIKLIMDKVVKSKAKICGFDLKDKLMYFKSMGMDYPNMEFDLFIAHYLCEPEKKDHSLKTMALEEIVFQLKDSEELLGKGKKAILYSDVEEADLIDYMSKRLFASYKLKEIYKTKITENDFESLYYDIELPLVEVLCDMEYEGFNVNTSVLDELDIEITEKVETLRKEIFELSEVEFNINSPKQLGEILFDVLKLPVIKKTKTGYSTSHDVLIKLRYEHEIVDKVMEYRTYTKLKSTYIDGLRAVINPISGKIHSSLNQTVAVTGRLSSTEPNLQNIPVRLDFGRLIRKVFIAKDNEHKLVDADYSQIELRILAHLSQDDNLLRAFRENIDVHRLTASQVFGVPEEDVTSLERSRAKEVNFGIVYGMSDYGLSENLKISRKEAKEYIDGYFANYPNVKGYMDSQIDYCKENGFITTIFNRRRFIPEINSKNFNIRSFAERTAMNTPIQGSAADIIKIAMVKVYNKLKEENLKSRLILQVHDELIIDTDMDELEKVKEILVNSMESAAELLVPLSVDLNVGDSWYETK